MLKIQEIKTGLFIKDFKLHICSLDDDNEPMQETTIEINSIEQKTLTKELYRMAGFTVPIEPKQNICSICHMEFTSTSNRPADTCSEACRQKKKNNKKKMQKEEKK